MSQRAAIKSTRLHTLLTATTSGAVLPSSIVSLTLRSKALKGNAGATHWAKAFLPSVLYANPSITFNFQVPTQPAVDATTPPTITTPAPCLIITSSEYALPRAFPLTLAKADKLHQRFIETITSSSRLEALPTLDEFDAMKVEAAEPVAEVKVETKVVEPIEPAAKPERKEPLLTLLPEEPKL